ncbi:hypothetical protein WJX74_008984 [Apatococcus lobatus]|uniref:Deoxynucleoside kinase domain-containing protein n=1 Tax=Apatococcus lobatus TaxID=904363 RepID=A0AAW1R0Z1_9CHLO
MIATGKSSVLRLLAASGFSVAPEPVERWTPFLEDAYAHDRGHVALQCRIMLDTCVACPREDVVERCPFLQPITFIPAMRLHGRISEAEETVLQELNARLLTWRPHGLIILRSSLEEAKERIRKRARGCERGIDDAYLGILHGRYERAIQVFRGYAHIVDTTNVPVEDVFLRVKSLLQTMGVSPTGCKGAGG